MNAKPEIAKLAGSDRDVIRKILKQRKKLAPRAGLEPATHGLTVRLALKGGSIKSIPYGFCSMSFSPF